MNYENESGWNVRIRNSMDEIRRISKDYEQTERNWEKDEMMGKAAKAAGKSIGYKAAVEILAEALSDEHESDCEKCHIGLAIKWKDGVMECPHCTHRWEAIVS